MHCISCYLSAKSVLGLRSYPQRILLTVVLLENQRTFCPSQKTKDASILYIVRACVDDVKKGVMKAVAQSHKFSKFPPLFFHSPSKSQRLGNMNEIDTLQQWSQKIYVQIRSVSGSVQLISCLIFPINLFP